MPLRVDVGEDGNEEGWWVPLRTQLPPAGLAKLQGRGVRGQQLAPSVSLPSEVCLQGMDTRFQCSREHLTLRPSVHLTS